MSRKIISAIALIALLSCSTCKKFLDITPQYEFTSALALSSLQGLSNTVTGGFNQLQSSYLYGGGIISNSELLADFVNADAIADYSLAQLRSRQMDPNNAQSGGMWSAAYRAIYIANIVLQNLPNFASQNPSEVQLLKGECYFIRGAMHFELVRMFAQPSGFTPNDSHLGIPIILSPGTLTSGQNTPRSTVAQCYKQIESDLDSAVMLLPAKNLYVSKVAAEGFLVRVYFTQNNFTAARSMADTVVNSGAFSLDPTVGYIDSVSGETPNPEAVFQNISTAPNDISNGAVTGPFKWIPLQAAELYMSDTFVQKYLEPDSAGGSLRFKELYSIEHYGSGYRYYTKKYNDQYMNVTVMRYAEILLDRAECNAQPGGSEQAALADINAIRLRAGLLPVNSVAPGGLINLIWVERDMELAMEGDHFFELKRRKQGFYSPESGTFYPWNSPALVYPIPLQEIQENKNMVQNPGY